MLAVRWQVSNCIWTLRHFQNARICIISIIWICHLFLPMMSAMDLLRAIVKVFTMCYYNNNIQGLIFRLMWCHMMYGTQKKNIQNQVRWHLVSCLFPHSWIVVPKCASSSRMCEPSMRVFFYKNCPWGSNNLTPEE